MPGTAAKPKTSSPQVATFEELFAKPRRKMSFSVTLADADGNPITRTMVYQAISAPEYDELVAKNQPTAKQREDGAQTNIDTFAPALISAVALEPTLTYEQAELLYKCPDWAGGEISTLYFSAQRICNSGLDVPFNDHG